MNRTKKIILVSVGSITLVLGTLGLFIPLLPTTPFWLVTAWCYIRSSDRLYKRVMANKCFGSYIKDYVEDKAIPMQAKITTLTIMWGSTLLTSIFLIEQLWIILCLIFISIGVTWHILTFPTKKKEKSSL